MKRIFAIVLALLLCLGLGAQSRMVSGKVVDERGEAIIGAGVVCKDNPKVGTICDAEGRFSLEIPEGVSTVVFSSIGMESLEYSLSKNPLRELTIVLHDDTTLLDQAVVTGYAQTTVKKITGSVGIISAEKFEAKPISSVSSLMQGEVAGVSIKATSGQPGSQAKIRIRGTNNITGNSEPLWVVDGVPLQSDAPSMSASELSTGGFDNIFTSGIGSINPGDIESITILKDAAAAAIYGSRASNGVIVVTTKKGKAGRMKLSYSNNFTFSFRPERNPSLMNSSEKLSWEQELWDEFSASGYEKSLSDNTAVFPIIGLVGQIRAGVGEFAALKGDIGAQDRYIDSLREVDTDWYSLLFRNAFSHNHHLSLSGGSEKCTYYVSLGLNDENGMLIRNKYQRYNLKSNISLHPIDRVTIDLRVEGSRQISRSPDSNVDAFEYAYFANPYEKAYEEDGSYASDRTYFSLGYYNGRGVERPMPSNGFSILRELNLNSTKTANTAATASGQIEVKILDQLKFVGLASYSFTNNSTDKIVEKSTYTAFRDRLGNDDRSLTKLYGSITQNRANSSSYMARGQFAYNQTFGGRHTLNVLAGAEIRGASSNTIFSKRYNYDPKTGTTSLPEISGPTDQWVKEVERLNGQYFTESRYASFYASADYYLGDTFVFNGSFRTDGSSNFGSDRQFNPTWSVGAAWHLGEEPWLKNKSAISHATLRAAYGYTGDVSIGTPHQLVMQYIQQQYRYYNGESLALGSIPTAPNPRLGWERTQDVKLGVDMGFFKDRLTVGVEGYYRLSTDVVSSSQISSTTGFTSVSFNNADICNTGVEATLSGKIVDRKGWKLSATVNFAYNYNKVLKYVPAGSGTITSKDRYVAGYPIGAILSGKPTGIDPDSGLYSFRLRPDATIRGSSDLNKPDNYRFYLGTTIAPYSGGFNITAQYKILKLSISGVYSFGNKVFDNIDSPASYTGPQHSEISPERVQSQYSDLYSNHLNVGKDRTSRWTEASPKGVLYPRIYDYYGKRYNFEGSNPMDSNIINAIYVKDVSYLRIKTILLSCELPAKWAKKIRFDSASLNLSLNNFFTLTSYDGFDPEVPGATYPTTRSLSVGLTFGF